MTEETEVVLPVVAGEMPDDRPLRAQLLDTIGPCTKNGQAALIMLERLEKALLATATAAARDSATDARMGFEVGAQAFMRPL